MSKPPAKDESEILDVVLLEDYIDIIEAIRSALDGIDVNENCKCCKRNVKALDGLTLLIESTDESRH